MRENGIAPAILLPQIKSKGKSDRYSENLAKWVKNWGKTRCETPLQVVFLHWSSLDGSYVEKNDTATQVHQTLIGRLDDDGWFYGSRLSGILSNGGREEVFAWPRKFEVSLLPRWFDGYIIGGKCFIDPEHRWYGDRDRWQLSDDGNSRACLWCGEHTQEKYTIERTVIDTHWRAK